MNNEQFKASVYATMRHVFDVHRELGRLFHEKIYQREVAFRVPEAQRGGNRSAVRRLLQDLLS